MEYTRNNRYFYFSAVFIVAVVNTGMACQIEKTAFEIHTNGRIPCRHNIPPDLIDLVRWTKSTDEKCYKNGGPSLVSWEGDRNIQDQNYGIDTDFSLVIPDVTTTFIGIYRCTVIPKDTTAISDSDTRLTVCRMEETTFEIHTYGRIPCRHNITRDLIDLVRWTKSTDEDCYQKGGQSLVSWEGDRNIQDQNYGIDTDFSLVIPDVTTTFIGIYRCTVIHNNNTAISDSDTRLTVYKYPDNPPSITYEILGGHEIEINCTHGPVFPLLYPSFPFPYHKNHTIRNSDGTYMVSINAVHQFSGREITLYCSQSYPGQHRSSFLNVIRSDSKQDDDTTHPPESTTTQKNNSIPTEPTLERDPRDSTFGIIVVILILIIIMMVIIIAVLGLGLLRHKRRMKSIQKLVQDPEKQEMDGTHELFKLMLMQLLLMKEMEEVKNKLQVTDPELCQRSGKGNLVTPNNDQGKENEPKKLMPYIRGRGSPEQTPLMAIKQDENEEGIEVALNAGLLPIVNRLRNIREDGEQSGMLLELAATLRALQVMETSEHMEPPSTEGANISYPYTAHPSHTAIQFRKSEVM